MRQANLIEEKCDLSELVKMLEARDEDVVYLAKEGAPVAQLALIPVGERPSVDRA